MNLTKNEIIITGINGFVAEHLARHLKSEGYFVTGLGRETAPREELTDYIDSYIVCDLLDKEAVNSVPLNEAVGIIHLAGFASVTDSFKLPDLYKEGNAEITDNLLSSALAQDFKGRALVVSTGAIYASPQDMPLKETSRIEGTAPYPIGKIRAEEVARRYKDKGLNIVIARPFNHIGPGQVEGFLLPDLYAEIVKAKAAGEKRILVGNLKTRRDYSDVRDIVVAYELLTSAPELKYDAYNVCSGKSYSGEEILQEIKKVVSADDIKVVVDPERIRPSDVMEIVGDSSRLRDELHWETRIPLSQTIKDFVDWKSSSS